LFNIITALLNFVVVVAAAVAAAAAAATLSSNDSSDSGKIYAQITYLFEPTLYAEDQTLC
jgi:hypothetical protein